MTAHGWKARVATPLCPLVRNAAPPPHHRDPHIIPLESLLSASEEQRAALLVQNTILRASLVDAIDLLIRGASPTEINDFINKTERSL